MSSRKLEIFFLDSLGRGGASDRRARVGRDGVARRGDASEESGRTEGYRDGRRVEHAAEAVEGARVSTDDPRRASSGTLAGCGWNNNEAEEEKQRRKMAHGKAAFRASTLTSGDPDSSFVRSDIKTGSQITLPAYR